MSWLLFMFGLDRDWETAYKIGYEDGKRVAEAQYKWTDERLRQECMLLHFEADEERRKRLGLKGLGEN